MDLSQLWEARNGRPNEAHAARTIASFAVIPAALVGLFVGTRLVGLADPFWRLFWVCSASALVAGLGAVLLVSGVHARFGFRPVVILADAIGGGLMGLLGGSSLSLLLMAQRAIPPFWAWLPMALVPFGAVAVPVYQAWKEAPRRRATLADTMGAHSSEAEVAPDREHPA
jgi:hypothetical protein